MLGVTTYDEDSAADLLLKQYAQERGFGDTYAKTRVGVLLGEPGETVPDPYFGGEGPERAGCVRCGSCMVGCRYNAKNTLVKNYLYFAERRGVEIMPERTVVDIRARGAADGSDGYTVTHERSGAWLRRDQQRLSARGVVVAAGPLGTNRLLFSCKLRGSLPRVSDRLGYLVRTNSRIDPRRDRSRRRTRFHTRGGDHVQRLPGPQHPHRAGDLRRGCRFAVALVLTHDGGRNPREPAVQLALNMLRHPRQALGAMRVRAWSRRTVILLVMQTLDNAMRLRVKRRWPNGDVVLTTEQDPENPNPDKIPAAYRAAEWMQDQLGGSAQAVFTESIFSIPLTAHMLGGAVIGADPQSGVIDGRHRVFGYENLLVCDGAAVPANVGANPSLTITALAERAMACIPPKGAADELAATNDARPSPT